MSNLRIALIIIIVYILICQYKIPESYLEKFTLPDFKDYSQSVQNQPHVKKRTRYNDESVWNEAQEKIFTVVGGESTGPFTITRKFRFRRSQSGHAEPQYFIETSTDGKAWDFHPEYSFDSKSMTFQHDTVHMQTRGGDLTLMRYPNGRLWLGNEDDFGVLTTLELADIKIPFLTDKDADEGANETTSALSGKKSIL